MEKNIGRDASIPKASPYVEKKENMEVHRSNLLQLAWAERSCSKVPEKEREKAMQQWLLTHGQWFRDTVIRNEENRALLYQDTDDETLDELDELFGQTSTAH